MFGGGFFQVRNHYLQPLAAKTACYLAQEWGVLAGTLLSANAAHKRVLLIQSVSAGAEMRLAELAGRVTCMQIIKR